MPTIHPAREGRSNHGTQSGIDGISFLSRFHFSMRIIFFLCAAGDNRVNLWQRKNSKSQGLQMLGVTDFAFPRDAEKKSTEW